MKKLLTYLFGWMLTPETNKDEINGCFELTFKDKTLAQSIAINEQYNDLFKSELNQRHVKAMSDIEAIENYFDPKRKTVYKVDVNDPTFLEPIKIN